ncbi:hypothetical protein [Alteromonas stellipolaris]|nr:hypothetical protein [Alteromonas stellipolaris]MDO6535383.1 hypothetical protein [Alteromonas stellipolaris]MDO6627259.1 hypothetical protein [Alteromonas stellipolaris]
MLFQLLIGQYLRKTRYIWKIALKEGHYDAFMMTKSHPPDVIG